VKGRENLKNPGIDRKNLMPKKTGLVAESVDWIRLARDCLNILKQQPTSQVGQNLSNSRSIYLKVCSDL
jgi:hypothetical protein